MAKNRASANSVEAERYALGFAPDGFSTCVQCGDECSRYLDARHPDAFQLGHVIPDSKGGRFEWENLAPQCRACNDTLKNSILDVTTLKYDPWKRYSLPSKQAAEASIATRRRSFGEAAARKVGQWNRPV